MIQRLEELSINAWPATQTLLYDGWVLRLASGYTRRANSVNPLYPSTLDVDQKLETCRSFYRSRGLPLIIKLTSAVYPSNLDGLLAERGFQHEALTSMQTLDLNGLGPCGEGRGSLLLYPGFSEDWLDDFYRISQSPGTNRAAHRAILQNLIQDAAYCTLRVGGQAAACGLAVLEDGYLGVYDVATHPEYRRQGCALRVMQNLLSWGKERGARSAYLQVMKNNPPALNLYARLGFREQYVYWYRVHRQ